MSTDNRAAETPIKLQKDQIFGEKGFGVEYFEPEVLTEAIVATVNKIDFDHLRGFTSMHSVFRKSLCHHVPLSVINKASGPVDGRDLRAVQLVGEWEARVGLISRAASVNPPIGGEVECVSESTWTERVRESGTRPAALPMQVSSLMSKVGVLSKRRRLYTGSIAWTCDLSPSTAIPEWYTVDSLQFDKSIYLRGIDEVADFVRTEGKAAAFAVLDGLWSLLHSSNREVEEDLSKNQKAEAFVEKIVARVRG